MWGFVCCPTHTAKHVQISKAKKKDLKGFFHAVRMCVSGFPSVTFLPGHACGANASGAVACEVSDPSDPSLLADPHYWNMT